MKISIITVSYNAVGTIEQTIQSVLTQNYADIEYIIIDGGSTDGTVDIIKKYENELAYWVSEPDGGIYDAMNKGIRQASGDIIGIINSDDWYAKDTVDNVGRKFLQDSAAVVVHGDIIRVSPDGNPMDRCKPFFEGMDIWHEMIVHHPTCFLRRRVYEQYGLYATEYKVAGDYEFFLRLYTNHLQFTYLSSDIAYFRVDGISATSFKRGMREVCDISQRYGYGKGRAVFWYYFKVIKHQISCWCTVCSLGIFVKLYHMMLGHDVQEINDKGKTQ